MMPFPDLSLYEIWMGPYIVGSVNQASSPSSLFVWNYDPISLLIVSLYSVCFFYQACALIIIYLFNQLSNMKVVVSLVSIQNEIYDWHGAKFLMVQISVLW